MGSVGPVRIKTTQRLEVATATSRRVAAAALTLLVTYSAAALAETSPADQALAQSLFDRGR